MAEPAGVIKENQLRQGGFQEDEITQWKAKTRDDLFNAGFSGQEINDYFGIKEPDQTKTKDLFKANIQAGKPQTTEGAAPKEFDFIDAVEAGFQMSVSGLIARGHGPDKLLPEDSGMFYRIASQVGGLAGDIPAMIAGGVVGGAAGTAATANPIGGTIGAGAGAFALPQALRQVLIDQYTKGEVKDFGDFWERTSAAFIEASKGALIGGATAGVGGAVGKVVGPAAISPIAKGLTQGASEVATMVTVGKALEGEVPDASDFVEAGILVGGLHGAMKVSSKLRNIYAEKGIKPTQVVEDMDQNPVLKQEMLAENRDVPKIYGGKPEEVKVEISPQPEIVDRPESVQKILNQIGKKEEVKSKSYGLKDFYRDYVDKLDPINDATDILTKDVESIKPDENPYQLSRMANDFKGKTKYTIEKGTLDYETLAKTGKSFTEIVNPFKEDLQDFRAYLLSKRAIEVEARGIKSGFDVEAAKEVVSLGSKKYESAAKDLVEFQNRNLKYLKDAGILSDKSFQAMKDAGQAYIPLRRIMDTEDLSAGKAGKGSSLKRLKGSERKVQDPLVSVVENSEVIFKLSERNRAVRALIDANEASTEKLFEKVPQPLKAIEVKENEVAAFLKEQGADPSIAESFTIFRAQSKNLAQDEFQVFRDGKREVYKAKDPELAKAIKSLDGDIPATNVLFKLARGITTVKKLGITLTPDFILRNVFRDQLTAGTFTKGGTIPFTDMVVAMGDLFKKSEIYYDWLKSGGGGGGFLELNENYIKKEVFKLNEKTGFIDQALNAVKKPIDFIRVTAEITEQATRLAEFKRVTKGETKGSKIFEGGFASREVTVDFQRMGAKLSALNSITAFQNVAIQGLDRTARAIKENPKGVTAKAFAYITVPSVLLWYANKDDPRMREIPRWQKDLFWIIPTDNVIYRIPKPQELGILFGSLPERLLEEFFTDNPKALEDFGSTMQGLLVPSLVPDAIIAPVEQYFNKSTFTGSPIIPYQLEKVLPAYQYTEYTSESAKAVGKLLALAPPLNAPGSLAAPLVLEHYIRAWSGNLGMYALQVMDKALGMVKPTPPMPLATFADIPAVKAFVVRYPSANTQSIVDFYAKFNENEVVLNTIKVLSRKLSPEWQTVIEDNESKLANLSGIRKSLSNQKKAIELISGNPEYSPVEQRQMIDSLYYGMIETAKTGNTLFSEFEKALKEQKKEIEKSSH